MASSLSRSILRRVQFIASVLKTIAVDYAPNHLKGYITVDTEERAGAVVIRLSIDKGVVPMQKWGTADARAQEFGAGLFARRGPRQTIPIDPVNYNLLRFYWEKVGHVVYREHVNHPGTEAANSGRGYLGPAIQEVKKTIIPTLDPDIRQYIDLEFRKAFSNRKK